MFVTAFLSAEKIRDSIVETCEAHVGLVKCQERSRKQFSPLLRSCEAPADLVKNEETSRKQFAPLC